MDPLTDELGTTLETEASDPLQVEVRVGDRSVAGWLSLVPRVRGTLVLAPAISGTLILDEGAIA